MNITRIALSNFKSWGSVELDIAPGVCLLSGANGAGKSSLVEACLFAMFGASSGAEALIRRGTDEARVLVEIQAEDGPISIGRSIRRSGNSAKVSLRVARETEDGFTDEITAATVTETQLILDDLLGVSREVLQASAFSTQFAGGSFTEAAPRDRKRVFSEILALGFWEQLATDAKAELRAATDAANVARAELERLDGAGERLLRAQEIEFAAHEQKKGAAEDERNAEAAAERLAAEAEAAREARRQHAAAVEAEQRARADHERAGVERQAADEALARAKSAAANAPSVEDAQAAVERANLAHAEADGAHAEAASYGRGHENQLRNATEELAASERARATAIQAITDLDDRLAEARSGKCAECRQPLVTDEGKALVDRLTDMLIGAQSVATSTDEEVVVWRAKVALLEDAVPEPPDDAGLAAARQAAQAAAAALAEAQTIQSLAGSIEAAQQRADKAKERWLETDEAMRNANYELDATHGSEEANETEARHRDAQTALAAARAAHSAAAAELARAEEAAKVAERQAAEETAARERLAVATREAAVATVLCEGFGPAGVPALIVDSVLGQLTETWNRVLAQVGARQRIDLRSQKLLKTSDRLADTLDIIVLDGPYEAPYETLSGGERTRVSVAGRIALTELLAHKTGARVGIMVLDEPAGLDGEGSEQLASVLNEFVASGAVQTILLITHADALADLIGRVVRIEKSASGESRLVEAPVGSPSPQLPSGDPSERERIAS